MCSNSSCLEQGIQYEIHENWQIFSYFFCSFNESNELTHLSIIILFVLKGQPVSHMQEKQVNYAVKEAENWNIPYW